MTVGWCAWMRVILLAGVAGCSRSGDVSTQAPSAGLNDPTQTDIGRLYDPKALVELRSLQGFPAELQAQLGVNATGYARIADVGEDCNPTAAHGADPGRCFILGGISKTSALVAFKVADHGGQSGGASAYVRAKSGWLKIREWRTGFPSTLRQLQEMTSFPPDDRKPPAGFDKCFRMVDGKCSY